LKFVPFSQRHAAPGTGSHEPHWQALLHVSWPQDVPVSQPLRVVPAAQTPWLSQVPNAPQVQSDWQVRVCLPQLPQSSVSVAFGAHAPSSPHAP
jgi:hypothetical protein